MPSVLIIAPVFLPILLGFIFILRPQLSRRKRNVISFILSIINLAIVIILVSGGTDCDFTLLRILDDVSISFRMDELGKLFAVLVSILWPFSLLYSGEYMEDEERQGKFFGFFMMTLGATLGIAFAKDILSLYIFYEILTLVTFPLVMHEMSEDALNAGKSYLTYMLGGAAFAFVGIIIVMQQSDSIIFKLGGNAMTGEYSKTIMTIVFFMMFCGFSVKAAMMPFGKWLIKAAVAPMPVTALLHAVAVVKAGAFAIIRLIYYIFGADYLRGTWAQYVCILLAAGTILYGSTMSVKEPHLKRRMAYSTISNLSYVIFGALLMSPMGMVGSLSHLIAHAVTKIGLFFCVGSIMHVTGKCYIYEIEGLGKKMKKIFICFTITAMSLIGVPQFLGFVSKFKLLTASIDAGGVFAYIGAFAIIISALLTAVYLFAVILRGYFPKKGEVCEGYELCHDPGWKMMTPIVFSSICVILLGILWEPIVGVINSIAGIA